MSKRLDVNRHPGERTMTRRVVVAAIFTFVSLAPGSVTAVEPTGETLAWNLHDCRYVYVTSPILSSRLVPYVPPGFQPVTVERIAGQPVSHVAFEMEICAEGSGLDGQVTPMIYAQSSIPVIAPQQYRVEQLGTFVKFHPLIPDADRRAHFNARGVPAFDGTVEIGPGRNALVPGPFVASTTYDGLGTFRLELVAGASDLPGGGEFIQYLAGPEDQLSYWRTEWQAETAFRTIGTVTLPPGSWEAEAFGATTVPVRGSSGTWSYTNGKVVLPD